LPTLASATVVPARAALWSSPRKRPILVSHRGLWTTLERLSPAHIPALQPLALDAPESWFWLPFGPFTEGDSFAAYLRMASASRSEILWAVRPHGLDQSVGRAAGWLGFLDVQPGHASLELGNVWFPPGLARTRSATEAIALLLGHVFDDLSYRRVVWKCDAAHAASRSAAERLGFRYEGTARAHMIVRGRRRDTAYYAMLWDEWSDRRAALAAWLAPSNFDAEGCARASLRRAR
jgi:RimJ/RimL family protein N-acetyltransferase